MNLLRMPFTVMAYAFVIVVLVVGALSYLFVGFWVRRSMLHFQWPGEKLEYKTEKNRT